MRKIDLGFNLGSRHRYNVINLVTCGKLLSFSLVKASFKKKWVLISKDFSGAMFKVIVVTLIHRFAAR